MEDNTIMMVGVRYANDAYMAVRVDLEEGICYLHLEIGEEVADFELALADDDDDDDGDIEG